MSKRKAPVYTDEQRIQRLCDQEEIKNLMGRRAMYLANDWRARELAELWVGEPENQKTASYGRNWGYYTGMEHIRGWYVTQLDKTSAAADGVIKLHPVTTPLVVLSDDGKTAQGTWWSLGFAGRPLDGQPEVYWYGIRIAADFVREPQGWRLWHLFESNDFEYECGSGMGTCKSFPEKGTVRPEIEFGAPDIAMDSHKRCFGWVDGYPQLPDIYDTFADTLGFGPEDHPRYQAGKEAAK